MHVFSIDPGNEQSAWMVYDTANQRPLQFAIEANDHLLWRLREAHKSRLTCPDVCVIEMVASYGMAVGKEVFETVRWIGRFQEAWDNGRELDVRETQLMYRKDVKMHLCGNNTAKDSNIRCALVDRYGPGKEKAIGKKATPGPLYDIANDVWSALAIAVTWSDKFAANTLAVAG